MTTDKNNPIQSADRIFAIMEALADNGPMRIIDLSERLGLHKSTVHRLLASLISMGYVAQDDRTGAYFLTFKLVELSGKILRNTDILAIVHPYISLLSEQCDETVHFVRRTGNMVTYLEKLESESVRARSFRLSSYVGLTRPMYCSAVGKAILAFLPEGEVDKIWHSSVIEQMTEYTITDRAALSAELARIRECGYAFDDQENELGISCIAVPVFDHNHSPSYAISISTITSRMTEDKKLFFSDLLKRTAAGISEAY